MWRLRAEIQSEVIIEPGFFEYGDYKIAITKFDTSNSENSQNTSENYRLCDIFLKRQEEDIDEAFSILHNELYSFIDKACFISYGKINVVCIISIAPDSVVLGDIFQLAVPQYQTSRQTQVIKLADLLLEDRLRDEQKRWIRLFSIGLNSYSSEESLLNYYTILEDIARLESTDEIVDTCEKCQHKTNTGRKKTTKFISSILQSHNIDSSIIEKIKRLRNKIAHGGATKNKEHFASVEEAKSYLEEVCLLEIENRIGARIKNRINAHVIGVPIFKNKFMCTPNEFEPLEGTHSSKFRFVLLKNPDDTLLEGQSAAVGTPLNNSMMPNVYDIAFPIVQKIEPQNLAKAYERIVGIYKQYLEEAKKCNNDQGKIDVYLKLGHFYRAIHNRDKSLYNYNRGIGLLEKYNPAEAEKIRKEIQRL